MVHECRFGALASRDDQSIDFTGDTNRLERCLPPIQCDSSVCVTLGLHAAKVKRCVINSEQLDSNKYQYATLYYSPVPFYSISYSLLRYMHNH